MHFIKLILSNDHLPEDREKASPAEIDLLPIFFSTPSTLVYCFNRLKYGFCSQKSFGFEEGGHSAGLNYSIPIEKAILQKFNQFNSISNLQADLKKNKKKSKKIEQSFNKGKNKFWVIFIDPSETKTEQSNYSGYLRPCNILSNSDGVNFTWREDTTDGLLRPFRLGIYSIPYLGSLHLFKKTNNDSIIPSNTIMNSFNNFFDFEEELKELNFPKSSAELLDKSETNIFDCQQKNMSQNLEPDLKIINSLKKVLNSDDETTVGILSVPPTLSIQELMLFLDPFVILPELSGIRLVVSETQLPDTPATRVMAFLKFRTFNSALTFYNHLNCQPFDVFEEATCYGIFVDNLLVKFDEPQPEQNDSYELPICPACLIRLDGTVTGLRGETLFDEVPLGWNWGSESHRCQVCCQVKQLSESPPSKKSNHDTLTPCQVCQSLEDRWVCLICAHIGCGRYNKAHARVHAESFHHPLALELGTGRVWDYLGDRYVHRVLHNQDNGHLLELPSNDNMGMFPCEGTSKKSEKTPRDIQEEIALLTMQLESQHIYFQSQVSIAEKSNHQLSNQLKFQQSDLNEKKHNASRLQSKISKVSSRISQISSKLSDLKSHVQEEESIFFQLLANLKEVRTQKKSQLALMDDLAAQLRDVNFFLSTQKTISNDLKELQMGSIELNSTNSKNTN